MGGPHQTDNVSSGVLKASDGTDARNLGNRQDDFARTFDGSIQYQLGIFHLDVDGHEWMAA